MDVKVKELMTADPVVAEVPGRRDDLVRLFLQHEFSGLPVVKARTRDLAGVVTRGDLLRNPDEDQIALIMTSGPYTVAPDDPVSRAAKIFFERRIHGLPVVENGELVGVISPADVLRTVDDADLRVGQFLARHVSPVHESTPLHVAWEIMRINHTNALPVLDDAGRLAGIVCDSDLFRRARVDERARTQIVGNADDSWNLERSPSVAALYGHGGHLDLPAAPVSEIAVRDVVTVYETASVADAAAKMVRRKVNQLPVLDADDRLHGMVTDLDLMAAKS